MAGIWAYTCGLSFASNTTGGRIALVRLNGTGSTSTTNIGQATDHVNAGQGASSPAITGRYRFAAGDYIECVGYQDSGTAVNVTATNVSSLISNSWFEATYISR